MVIATFRLPVVKQWSMKSRSHLQLRDSVGFAPTSLLSKLHAIYTYYSTVFSCEIFKILHIPVEILKLIVKVCGLKVN